MNREMAIIIWFFIVVVSVTASDYAGLSFQLTRSANDKFQNPTAKPKVCNWEAKYRKFCIDTNSRCDGNCCTCTCDYQTSTFDRSTMECRNNDVLRSGCKAKFDGQYTGSQVQILDLSKKGEKPVYWPVNVWNDKVKSFNILNITSHHDGREVNTKFLVKKGRPRKRGDGNWQSVIQWNPVSKENYGKLFKVSISYEIERNVQGETRTLKRNDCFVFKSSGSITVTFPRPIFTTSADRSTTTSFLITTPPKTTPKTTKRPSKNIPSSNVPSTQMLGKPTDLVDPPITTNKMTKSTSFVSSQIRETKKTRKPTEPGDNIDEQSSSGERKEGGAGGGGSNAITVSLAVVGCIVLLGLVVLLVLWTRRRAAKASRKKNEGVGDADGSVDNPTENIYSEADNSMNYFKKDKNNFGYDYASGNYTSLDMNKIESKPTYESLINTQNSMYEQIPANYNTSSVSGVRGGIALAEPLYHAVDTPEGSHNPGQMYHEPDNYRREMSGRTGVDNPERVYSTLEEEGSPENYCREVPGRTGDDYSEKVYSTLEEEGSPENYCREVPGRTDDDYPERVYSTLEEEGSPENYCREVPGRTDDENPERVYSTLEEEGSPENYCREVSGRTDDENPERVYSVLEDDIAESDYLAVLPDYEQPINPPMPDA